MKQEIIDKLPPDVQKEYMKMAIKLSEKEKQIKVQDDFCPAPAIENTSQVISIYVCPPCNLMKGNPTSTPATCAGNNGTEFIPTENKISYINHLLMLYFFLLFQLLYNFQLVYLKK